MRLPLIALSPDWELAFAESLAGPPEDRQLAMAPSKLQEFMQRLRDAFDAAFQRQRQRSEQGGQSRHHDRAEAQQRRLGDGLAR